MRWPALIIITSAVLWTGCVHLPADREYAGPPTVPPAVAEAFAYEGGPPRLTNGVEVIETADRYAVRRIRLASTVNLLGSDHTITIDHYDVEGEEPTPVIVVLPILGGKNKVARIFAEYFARHGYAAVIVHRQREYLDVDELEQLNPVFRQIVIDHKQALDWIATQPDLDPERIGLFGVSAGAIKGALVCGLDGRIRAAVLGLAGGDVPYIYAYSRDKGIRKRRRRILEEHGITADDLYEALSGELVHDPLDYAHHIDAADTLLILAAFDAVVPYKKGLELREAIGDPETIVLPTGHYGAILYLPYIKSAALAFFRERFERPGG